MLVRDLMRYAPNTCRPNANVAAITELLWTCGCGALPVTEAGGKLVGVITDRDICVAVGTQDRRPSELIAEQVMSRDVATCRASDDIHSALKIMRTRKVRRLPVLNEAGRVEGVLCISDLILDAQHDSGSRPALSYEDVMNALKEIYRHRLPPAPPDRP